MIDEVIEAAEPQTEDAPAGAQPGSLDELKPKMKLTGKVARLELYGAFIDLGVGSNAILHISQLGKEKVNRVADVLNVGDEVTVWVDKVDPARGQAMVTMIEPLAVDWSDLKEGATHTGTVTRLEKFGAFVDIGAEKEGLVHISELSHDYVKHPSEVLKPGDEVQVKVLGFSKRKRRIDLSIKALLEQQKPAAPEPVASREREVEAEVYDEEIEEEMPTAMEIALRRAMGNDYKADRRKQLARKSRQQQRRMREEQDDIIARTLRMRE
jgi:small subunit ribosomal protein S1